MNLIANKLSLSALLFFSFSNAPALTLDNRARLWTENAKEVPVCFSEGFASWSATKRYVVEMLRISWEANAGILFTHFDTCDGYNNQARVRVLVKRGDGNGWGGQTQSVPGMATLRAGPLPECYVKPAAEQDRCVWSVILWTPSNATGTLSADDKQQIKYLTVHEFGHVLGFDHEQDSDRNFNFERELSVPGSIKIVPTTEKFCRPASKPGIKDHKVLTPGFDVGSVMVQGYCEGGWRIAETDPWRPGRTMAPGTLTPRDISGVQMIYGKPTRKPTTRPFKNAPPTTNGRVAPNYRNP